MLKVIDNHILINFRIQEYEELSTKRSVRIELSLSTVLGERRFFSDYQSKFGAENWHL